MPARSRTALARSLATVAVGLITVVMLLRWFEQSQVYHPHRHFALDGGALRRPWKEVWFTTTDGIRINAWFFPAVTNSPSTTNPTSKNRVILFSHGNGGNISHRFATYEALLSLGLDVLAYDYRGYGRSDGKPSEEGTLRDALAAHAWLTQQGYQRHQIIAHGESLGGAVAAALASRAPVGGLILQSTFTSLPDIGAELFPWLPVRTLARIRYDTRSLLPKLTLPLLILHSRADTLIGFHHATNNFAAANSPKTLHEIAGDHNDGPEANLPTYLQGVRTFIDSLPAP